MAAEKEEIERKRRELARYDELLRGQYDSMRGTWTFGVGRFRVGGAFTSGAITKIYILFVLMCGALGGALTFVEAAKELGIALLAGAILAIGQFTSQFWAVAVQRDRSLLDAHQLRLLNRQIEDTWKLRDTLEDEISRLEKAHAAKA